MNRKLSIVALLATAGLVATSTAAFATQAILTQDANVRQTASGASAIVNHVDEDQEVEVLSCGGTWCKIAIPGPNGYVKKTFLAALDEDEDDEIPFHMSVGPSGVSFGIGDVVDVAIPLTPQICFYTGNNYTGGSFCEVPGSNNDSLGAGFNDTISSVQIQGATSFTVCQHWFYGGACANYTSSKPVLNGTYNDQVSSYKVF